MRDLTEKSPATVLANVLFALATVSLTYSGVRAFIDLPLFALREVWVLGSIHHVDAADVERLIRRDLRGNFFTLNLKEAKTAFEKLPWVRSASLSRAWPNTLVVRLEEQVPLARWGEDALVNIHGERFSGVVDAPLPHFSGPDGSEAEVTKQYRAFLRVLEPISLTPVSVRLSERGAWQLKLSNDLSLELGREDMEARLSRFVQVYPQFVSLTRDDGRELDLRYDNGFAMTRVAGAAKGSE
jgi:cell division protein FtsQ